MSSNPGSIYRDTKSGTPVNFEGRIQKISAGFTYPPTPELAPRVRDRLANQSRQIRRPARLAYSVGILILLILAAMLVSPVRARVVDWITLGAARIFPAATMTLPAPTPVKSVLDLAGETSLTAAQEQLTFTVLLPAYPDDLGQPDHVYVQRWGKPVIVLVWMDPDQPDRVRMSLTEASSNEAIFQKYTSETVMNTRVSGQPAVWIDGQYMLVMGNGDAAMTRLVNQGHTLIWTYGELTFRLETDTDLETAVRVAESIR